jgi:Trk-type K+ transport system membrane component
MLVRLWSKGNTLLLLVGVQTSTTTLEINLAVFKKVGNSSTSRTSYTTPTQEMPHYTTGTICLIMFIAAYL